MHLKSLDELKYVNLIPEQREQFLALRRIAAQNEPDAESKRGLAAFRQLDYGFQKIQLKFNYFLLNIAGKLGLIVDSINKWFKPMSATFDALWKTWGDIFTNLGRDISKVADFASGEPDFFNKCLTVLSKTGNLLQLIVDSVLYISLLIDDWIKEPFVTLKKSIDEITGGALTRGDNLAQAGSDAPSIWNGGKGAAIQKAVEDWAKAYKIDPSFFKAIIGHESGFDPNITSPRNRDGTYDRGIAQLNDINIGPGRWVESKADAYNPYKALPAAARHLADYVTHFHGNLAKAALAYNKGLGGANTYLGSGANAESYPYVADVLRRTQIYRRDIAASQALHSVNSSHKNVTMNSKVTINVHGSSDPHKTAKAVMHEFEKTVALRNLQGNFA